MVNRCYLLIFLAMRGHVVCLFVYICVSCYRVKSFIIYYFLKSTVVEVMFKKYAELRI